MKYFTAISKLSFFSYVSCDPVCKYLMYTNTSQPRIPRNISPIHPILHKFLSFHGTLPPVRPQGISVQQTRTNLICDGGILYSTRANASRGAARRPRGFENPMLHNSQTGKKTVSTRNSTRTYVVLTRRVSRNRTERKSFN